MRWPSVPSAYSPPSQSGATLFLAFFIHGNRPTLFFCAL